MSRDATGIWSARGVALTTCPVCKARKGVACNMAVEGYQEHNTHFARTEQPISQRRSNAYRFPDDKYKKDLVVVGALGILKKRTPAYVEAVVVDTLGRRWARQEYSYDYPEDFDPSDICMIPLPSFKAAHKKHVLLCESEDIETLSNWDKHPSNVQKFVSWLRSGNEKDMTLGACRLEGGVAWLASPRQSETVLKYLAKSTLAKLQDVDLDPKEVERLAWHLQRCARGATTYMAHAAVAFESIERRDFSDLMARACLASPEKWKRAKRRAVTCSKRYIQLVQRLNRESLEKDAKEGRFFGQRRQDTSLASYTTLNFDLGTAEPTGA